MESGEKNLFERQLATLEEELNGICSSGDNISEMMKDAEQMKVRELKTYDVHFGSLVVSRNFYGFFIDSHIKQSTINHETHDLKN